MQCEGRKPGKHFFTWYALRPVFQKKSKKNLGAVLKGKTAQNLTRLGQKKKFKKRGCNANRLALFTALLQCEAHCLTQ
jgi:hypothetical protein